MSVMMGFWFLFWLIVLNSVLDWYHYRVTERSQRDLAATLHDRETYHTTSMTQLGRHVLEGQQSLTAFQTQLMHLFPLTDPTDALRIRYMDTNCEHVHGEQVINRHRRDVRMTYGTASYLATKLDLDGTWIYRQETK